MMKLGLGLYRHMLTPDNFRFARQAGATHTIAHLTSYFDTGPRIPTTEDQGWGMIEPDPEVWSVDSLRRLKETINQEGLELEAIENLNPADWYDVLLAGPKRQEQLEWIKQIILNMGQVGIPILGYNFSIAGVWGHVTGPYARGGARSVGFLGSDGAPETPIPNGMVWNMMYNPTASPGQAQVVSQIELWDLLPQKCGAFS
jgi:mannonate dehydratase